MVKRKVSRPGIPDFCLWIVTGLGIPFTEDYEKGHPVK
jgi:hypothetical protein